MPFISLDVPLETAGKRGHRISRGEHLSESARLKILKTAWQVRSELRVRLLELTAASQRLTLIQAQFGFQQRILDLLTKRLQAGAITSSELVFARITLQKTELDLADAQRQQIEARARVAEAIGLPVRALDGVELAFDLQSHPAPGEDLSSPQIRKEALVGRADIRAAIADYEASQSALQLELAKQYPDVHLNPGFQWDQGESKWQLGLTVELPVLNHNEGPIAEAEGRRAESAANFLALQATISAEIDRSLSLFHAAEKNLGMLSALAADQIKQREAVQAQVKAGAADQLDLLNAQFEFTSAELVRLDGQIKFQQALGALEEAVQHPMPVPQSVFASQPSHAP